MKTTKKPSKPKKDPLRFDHARDMALLEEVRNMNPFASELPTVLWNTMSKELNKRLKVEGTSRSHSGRLTLLLKKHKENETASLRRYLLNEFYAHNKKIMYLLL